MKYKCICLDHDDTVVNSTATIHYPCFIQYLGERLPHLVNNYTLESYFIKNFHPGILELLRDEVGLNADEIREEEEYWRDYVKNHIPSAYDGIRDILVEYRARGGIIAVTSHSFRHYIERDYRHNDLPMPDVIYGWDMSAERRKPAPYAVLDVMEKYSLSPSEVLVIDDLKPGYDMARAAGVDFAAAGWAYDVPEIEEFMRKNCDYYLKTPEELAELLGR
ncbi:MAG: HAD family hydrolase [Clostridia bacterium]|nr:HAD family hydrolase [Clostridia bacterium]